LYLSQKPRPDDYKSVKNRFNWFVSRLDLALEKFVDPENDPVEAREHIYKLLKDLIAMCTR